MRLPLSRLTAVLVLGVALAAVPGVAVSRVGGREGTARMATRGGPQRLSASEAIVHGYDDTAPDSASVGDLVSQSSDRRDQGAPPGLPRAHATVQPPLAPSLLLPATPADALHPTDAVLRPPGRAPPLR